LSDVAIRVENLGKRYRIGRLQQQHDTLRDTIVDTFQRLRVNTVRRSNAPTFQRSNGDDMIWALKDVSFEVKRGEVVGIIGRNGAGKSTLLKILSRITKPTEGWADIHGRVGSLLEVGTGFHPELTGRENIYLNGAILGMHRVDIDRKFDEIVAFAEVEKFIDTPVKRYSSGMYVRLAFAVAAHLEPEILLVDEVLAVGDIAFQEKCLGKMGEVAGAGRTVLFVSHNLGSIQRLCTDAMLLNYGSVQTIGKPAAVVQDYLALIKQNERSFVAQEPSDHLAIDIRVLSSNGIPTIVWPFGEKLVIDVRVSTPSVLQSPAIDIAFYTASRVCLFALQSDRLGERIGKAEGVWGLRFEIENPGIMAAEMYFDVGLREGNMGYTKLIRNAGTLSADQQSIPTHAQSNGLLYPHAKMIWLSEKVSASDDKWSMKASV
jgi:homopolymeric O-antigen transport system ATP-binding protein